MSITLDQLIGDVSGGRIRGIVLGSPLAAAIEREGDDFSERKRRKFIKYIEDLAPGEELQLVLFYDDARNVRALTLYYNYFLAEHDDDTEPFEHLAAEVHAALTKVHGDAALEERAEGEGTKIRSWHLSDESKLVSMTYTVRDRDDHRYDQRVLKLEHGSPSSRQRHRGADFA